MSRYKTEPGKLQAAFLKKQIDKHFLHIQSSYSCYFDLSIYISPCSRMLCQIFITVYNVLFVSVRGIHNKMVKKNFRVKKMQRNEIRVK